MPGKAHGIKIAILNDTPLDRAEKLGEGVAHTHAGDGIKKWGVVHESFLQQNTGIFDAPYAC
jgi:hypothetical protein